MPELENAWVVGANGLYWSADGTTWERLGKYTYPAKAVLRQAHRTVVGAMWGLWEVRPDSATWTQLHDETLTEILALGAAQGDPGVVAGSSYGISWGERGEHGATRWVSRSDDLGVDERFTNALLADPAADGRWLVGTEAGVLVYSEGDDEWERTSLMGSACRALISAFGGLWAAADDRGVWRSDDGLSWHRAGSGLDRTSVFALAPTADGRLLAGTLQGVCVGDGRGSWSRLGPRTAVGSVAAHPRDEVWIAGTRPGGLWRTEDGGTSWGQTGGFDSVRVVMAPEGEVVER